MGSTKQPFRGKALLEQGVWALLVAVGGWIGLEVTLPGTPVGVIWPPAGITVAAMALRGFRVWPALVVGTLAQLIPYWREYPTIQYTVRYVGVALTQVLVSALVAALALRSIREKEVFGLQDFLWVMLMGGACAQAVSALLGAGGMVLLGLIPVQALGRSLFFWWSSNLLSVGLLSVWMLSLARPDVPLRELARPRALALLAAVVAGSLAAFSVPATGWMGILHLEVLTIFIVLMAAISLGTTGAATAAVLCAGLALAGTASGRGAFAHESSLGGLLSLQLYMLTIVVTAFVLGETRSRWKAATTSLKESNAWFQAVFHGVHDAVMVIDPGMERVERINGRARDLFRRTEASLLGALDDSPLGMGEGPLVPAKRGDLLKALLAGETQVGVWRLERGDGKTFWADGEMHLERLGGQERVLLTLRDITDRIEAEAEREALRLQFLQSQKLETVGLLAGGIAHDFNNLLTAFMGYAEQLGMLVEGQAKHCVEQLLEVADRGARLTRGILAFSRQRPRERHALDLNRVVGEILKLMERLMRNDIQISFRPARSPAVVLADQGQMEQVIVNLATNARDAMPRGGRLTLSLESMKLEAEPSGNSGSLPPGTYHCLSVSDTGSGMDAATVHRIFEPFFTTKEVGEGTGLGLSTVYGILKAHDGSIQVESEPGKGTTFRVYLPALDAAAPLEGLAAPETVRGKGECLLVAEDDRDIRQLIVTAFEQAGYRLLVACDGAEALRLFWAHVEEVALVVTDVNMPQLSGWEAVRDMRSVRPDLPVVFMSAFPWPSHLDEVDSISGADMVQKPIRMSVLLRRVRDCLDAV